MDEQTNSDFPELEAMLRAQRATATPDELERIRRNARARASQPAPRRFSFTNGAFMRSRIAVTSILVLGLVMSSAGAGLAVSGIASGGDSAAESQYNRTPPPPSPDGGDTLPDRVGSDDEPTLDDELPEDDPVEAEPARQLEADGSDSLPFTGLAAIPLLILGVGLLVTGAVLRRSRGSAG